MLIVDNKFDESIELAVEQLLQNGVPIGYWNGKDPKKKLVNNRIVLLDLILRDEDALRPAPERFRRAINALYRLRAASIVIILSNTADEPNEFKTAYTNEKGEYPGVISPVKIEKGNLDDPKELTSQIESAIRDHPEVRLALLLESVVDSAKDGAFQATLGRNVEVVAALIKILEKQNDREGLRRELVDTVIRILSRHAHSGEAYKALKEVLEPILARAPPDLTNAGGSLLSFLMYYKPEGDRVWTGDIFQTRKDDGRDIGIVLTPACDLAWDKPEFVTLALGFRLTEDVYRKRNSVLFQRDSSLRNLTIKEREAPSDERRTQVQRSIDDRIEHYKVTGKNLPEGTFILRHVDCGGELLDVCIDLKDLERVSLKKLTKESKPWHRITRLDSPFVEALLQRFGERTSRIGIPDFNLSLPSLAERANGP